MSLLKLLSQYRDGASSAREQGDYFERLVRVWIENAPTQVSQFSRVMSYGDWAREQGLVRTDAGIDLVAQLADEPDNWCAIQCKFYARGHRIQKPDLDTFISASARRPFTRRLFIDTTGVDWGRNAVEVSEGLDVPIQRIGLLDLDESGIDWDAYSETGTVTITKKTPRPDQLEAVQAVLEGLKEADRGKLIMACGTGKTYTALQIAQDVAGRGGRVLFLVPSLALMSQTIREWSIDSTIALRSFAVCSDVQVGVRRANADDLADMDVNHLEIPATTHGGRLAAKANRPDRDRMTVVFSTYQSIEAVFEAQTVFDLPAFDLIICDEAHRTTGATLAGEDESNFVRIHNADYISGAKRLYMTATPRVFGEQVQRAAEEGAATLASMDDEAVFGKTLFTRNFGWAVQNGLLTDYKVIVLAVDEDSIARGVQRLLADASNELDLDDATRMVGCYKALTKFDFKPDVATDTGVMRRALMFANSIKASKLIQSQFADVASQWRESLDEEVVATIPALSCEVRHVDGTMQANTKNEHLAWLKDDAGEKRCRILTNARCLTEGVDVPALDAIMFMHPRKSQIDVVQAVGRVMRRSPGKKLGYVILPIGVPAGVTPEQALNDNERYKVVWQILNALRSHDERLDADINKIDLGVASDKIEIVAVSDTLPRRTETTPTNPDIGRGGANDGDDDRERDSENAATDRGDGYRGNLGFEFNEYSKAILAKIVKKCGTRSYWEDWASDVAKIAQRHITRIRAAVEQADSQAKVAFEGFLAEIRDDLNDAVTAEEAIEMLAQHLITRPVFDALFEGYAFAEENPVSQAMEGVLEALDEQGLEKEARSLERFYASVRTRAAGVTNAAAKQKIVVELYDKFFKSAFPKLTQRMGIVYTPVQVVDFIIHSVEEVLQEEFGQSISDEGVHVIDPFTGTGTFITRLLQSGLIRREDMARKFAHEIHANEIILLAYYIAAINIEAVYYDLMGEEVGVYTPFPGICLTDTFQMYEKDDLISGLLADNSDRRNRQKTLPIKVIIGNPPYSAGQKSANDDAANVDYPGLDGRIAETYAERSDATNKNALYDSYIRAIRWGSDRLKDHGGVLAFVTNAGWLDANTADGLRKCLADEFTRIDVFHLRGNARTQGEQRRREAGNTFGEGTRTPVAIFVMTLNPDRSERGAIRFHDIGDYLSREDKLARVARFGSLAGITAANGWQTITPDEHGDWLNQRDGSFDAFIAMGDKKTDQPVLFETYSRGVETYRDAWAINPSSFGLRQNVKRLIATYEDERARLGVLNKQFTTSTERNAFVNKFVNNDPRKISWSRSLKAQLGKDASLTFDEGAIRRIEYRPFSPALVYFGDDVVDYRNQMPRLFPAPGLENRVIGVSGASNRGEFRVVMADCIPSLHMADMNGAQYFPRYVYGPVTPEATDTKTGDLFTAASGAANGDGPTYVRRDAITDEGLGHFQAAYPGEAISKDDIFDYVYGLLHHPTYRERYADNLTKELPRIPLMIRAEDLRAVVGAGRALGRLHADYDTVEPWPVTIAEGDLRLANIPDPVSYFRVEKMRFAKRTLPNSKKVDDRTAVVYNPRITLTNIPEAAWKYVVNGKPALAWVMERQCVKTDPASGIVSDANAYANETVGDPRYPLDLFCRVITVSIETMKIIEGLPAFDIREGE